MKTLNKQQKVCMCVRRLKELSKRMRKRRYLQQTLTLTDYVEDAILDFDKLNFVIHTLEEDHNDLSS
tara:strand:+ start:982 stop:1182 length:201 start_codon:yes stop_codon:yes gene_type:complete